jgi:MFS family permease
MLRAMPDAALQPYPKGFRPRRGLNWGLIGLLYASFYMCRYNFRFATPGMVQEFGFTTFQITGMLSAWSIAYGTGQLVNGLLTDRIGGKTAMLIGAVGTILGNAGVNIVGMQVGRKAVGERAVMVINLEEPISPELIAQLDAVPDLFGARLIDLR